MGDSLWPKLEKIIGVKVEQPTKITNFGNLDEKFKDVVKNVSTEVDDSIKAHAGTSIDKSCNVNRIYEKPISDTKTILKREVDFTKKKEGQE
ncbi:unnamed protein product [Diamesa tonsa]